jgi:predicted enzyme related to lactoylglutathione lyase
MEAMGVNNMNSVGWFEIYVADMHRAKAFYETVFDKKLEKLGGSGAPGIAEMWAFPGNPHNAGATGALVKMENGPSGPGGTIVYFVCEDCAVEAGRAAKNGGKIIKDKFSIGEYGFIALVADTEGSIVGLHSMK